jgi:hypothetical protein
MCLSKYDDYAPEYKDAGCPDTLAPLRYEVRGNSFMQMPRHCEARSNPESLTNFMQNNLHKSNILINTHTHTHTHTHTL